MTACCSRVLCDALLGAPDVSVCDGTLESGVSVMWRLGGDS